MCGCMWRGVHVFGGQKTACRSWVSSSTVGGGLGSPGLPGSSVLNLSNNTKGEWRTGGHRSSGLSLQSPGLGRGKTSPVTQLLCFSGLQLKP